MRRRREPAVGAAGSGLRRGLRLAVPVGLLWWLALGWSLLSGTGVHWAIVAALLVPPSLGLVALVHDQADVRRRASSRTRPPGRG